MDHSHRRVVSVLALTLVVFISLFWSGRSYAFGESRLKKFLAEANGAAVGQIRTLTAEVVVTPSPVTPSRLVRRIYYTRSDAATRLRCLVGKLVIDHVRRDGASMGYVNGLTPQNTPMKGATRFAADHEHVLYDPWILAWMRIPVAAAKAASIQEILQDDKLCSGVERRGRLIVVKQQTSSYTREIFFDPDVNHLFRRSVTRPPADAGLSTREETEVAKYAEPTPGLFFPQVIESRWYDGDRQTSTQSVVFENLRINEVLPDDAFVIEYPSGLTVHDSIRGVVYPIDTAGRPAGPERRVGSAPALPAAPAHHEPPAEPPPPKADPFRWEFLVLPFFALVTATALVWQRFARQRV